VAVGGQHPCGAQVVGRQAHLALEPAAPRAEREARHAGAGDAAAGHGQAVLLRGGVELVPQHAGLHPSDPAHRVHVDRLERAEVDHEAAVAGREAGRGVGAGTHRDLHLVGSGVRERGRDVGDGLAAGDQRRPTVDHRVVDTTSGVVAVVVGADQGAGEAMDRGR
jgi:hypothetical protein